MLADHAVQRTHQVFETDLAGAEGVDHGLDARAHREALLGTFDVVVGGALADAEQHADFGIALALGGEQQALALAGTQVGDAIEHFLGALQAGET